MNVKSTVEFSSNFGDIIKQYSYAQSFHFFKKCFLLVSQNNILFVENYEEWLDHFGKRMQDVAVKFGHFIPAIQEFKDIKNKILYKDKDGLAVVIALKYTYNLYEVLGKRKSGINYIMKVFKLIINNNIENENLLTLFYMIREIMA